VVRRSENCCVEKLDSIAAKSIQSRNLALRQKSNEQTQH
jgi:hypothetical protein